MAGVGVDRRCPVDGSGIYQNQSTRGDEIDGVLDEVVTLSPYKIVELIFLVNMRMGHIIGFWLFDVGDSVVSFIGFMQDFTHVLAPHFRSG